MVNELISATIMNHVKTSQVKVSRREEIQWPTFVGVWKRDRDYEYEDYPYMGNLKQESMYISVENI